MTRVRENRFWAAVALLEVVLAALSLNQIRRNP
jgi:hypothetical protein